MTPSDEQSPYDATPTQALTTLAAHDGPIVVDLDETLYLRNSTSDFLSSARPALLAFVLVKLVEIVKPWRLFGRSDAARDAWRVRVLLVCMPWTIARWRRQAVNVGKYSLNEPLADRIRESGQSVYVSTLGFQPIVEPLVQGFGLNGVTVVAMDPWRSGDRERGKLALTADAVGEQDLARSAVVTDSLADRELLDASAVPLRVVWPDASPGETFGRVYYPGRYLTQVKRPGGRYVRKILKEDIALWILCTVWVAENPFTDTIGLLLLALSFWAVYETGYVDNDLIAHKHEEDPALTDEFRRRKVTFPAWVPLVWAAAAGAVGVVVARLPSSPSLLDFLLWALVIWVSLGVFRVYNRLDKGTRILLFPVLQLLRTAAFVVIVPTVPIAILAIALHVMVRWVSYYVYRTVPGGWPGGAELPVVRLVAFVSLGLLLASQLGWSVLWSATTLSLLAWHLFLARRELPAAIANAHRIDR
ncbi:MAG: haloacid dehalogenase-like hydrolase [Actinomycetota bacterium]